jgi:hypothetical protein
VLVILEMCVAVAVRAGYIAQDPKVPLPYKSKSDITATTNKIYGVSVCL